MFYRRKVILAILQVFGNKLNRLDFQKLLFIFTRQQTKRAFDFVPYRYGCFSFQANDDLNTMEKYGQVKDITLSDKRYWKCETQIDFLSELNDKDKVALQYLKNTFSNYSSNELIKYTYTKYPYYAIKSTIAEEMLTEDELLQVKAQIPKKKWKALFTIGYEGISLETYLNKLILNDIKLLCDVRKNPLSMKNGFSKNQLKNACTNLGIEYVHIPNLGIDSDKRQLLVTQADYNKLFKEYKRTTIVQNKESLNRIIKLVEEYDRIALTCFEANHCQCHRGIVAQSIEEIPEWSYEITHLS